MSDDDILHEALERFKESDESLSDNRQEAEDDITFARLGEQWDRKVKEQRDLEGRPCLTINKLPAFVRQVVNDARQNKPGVIISPVDGEGDEATAHVIQGLVRNIERRSMAEVAYDTAIDHAVSGGFGFFRIVIDYVHPDSFSLEARIERIANPLMVHWDANSTAFDASDWDYCFVSEYLSADQFKTRYPDADPVDWSDDDDGNVNRWMDDDRIRLVEYWCRKEKTRAILGLSNGKTIRQDVMIQTARDMMEEAGLEVDVTDEDLQAFYLDQMGLTVIKERQARYHEVMRYILNGKEVLESDPWPGSMIPICPVWGEEVVIGGKRHLRSMIRDAKDPQAMFNFWRSASTELVALAPRAPWVGPEGFVPEGQEDVWATANTRSHAFLQYNPDAGPAPQRQPFAGVPAGALQEALNSSDDMKSIVGIYDASLGARSNETSGRAILARQRESDVSNFHFLDNLAHAIAYAGRVLVEILPAVYGPSEAVRILGEDGKEDVIRLTQEHGEIVDGEQRLYNLSTGVYDVSVTSGTSYQTKREETREYLMELMRQVPGAAQVIGDIVIKQFDFDGADEVAERLKMLLPPQVQQPQQPIAPQGNPGGQPPMGGNPLGSQ